MSMLSLEERLSALEKKVEQLAQQSSADSKSDWMSRVVGSFADCPEFDEVLRLGREFRQEQNAVEDIGDDEFEDGK